MQVVAVPVAAVPATVPVAAVPADVPVVAVPVGAVPAELILTFNEFICSSLRDVDESLWDAYSLQALDLLIEFKRRTRELHEGAPPSKKRHI